MADNGGNARLRSFIERIERLDDEIAAHNADKAEVYREAKGEGWNPAAMRAVIGERRKRSNDPARYESLQSDIEMYRAAVGTPIATRARTEAA